MSKCIYIYKVANVIFKYILTSTLHLTSRLCVNLSRCAVPLWLSKYSWSSYTTSGELKIKPLILYHTLYINLTNTIFNNTCTVKPVYKGHSRESENMSFMSSCPLYTGQYYMPCSLMGKMRLPFIDSDLLFRGDL